MATTTAGNVLAIQGQPEPLWDARVAVLQRYISAGQVIGLAIAGLLARSRPGAGFIVAGLALLAAGALAFVSAPHGAPRSAASKPAPRPMVGGDAGVSGPHHRGHHLSWPDFHLRVIGWPLRHFLIVWLIAYPAMNGFATLFPVAMDALIASLTARLALADQRIAAQDERIAALEARLNQQTRPPRTEGSGAPSEDRKPLAARVAIATNAGAFEAAAAGAGFAAGLAAVAAAAAATALPGADGPGGTGLSTIAGAAIPTATPPAITSGALPGPTTKLPPPPAPASAAKVSAAPTPPTAICSVSPAVSVRSPPISAPKPPPAPPPCAP